MYKCVIRRLHVANNKYIISFEFRDVMIDPWNKYILLTSSRCFGPGVVVCWAAGLVRLFPCSSLADFLSPQLLLAPPRVVRQAEVITGHMTFAVLTQKVRIILRSDGQHDAAQAEEVLRHNASCLWGPGCTPFCHDSPKASTKKKCKLLSFTQLFTP
jgi:hypothetical protein